VLRVRKNFSSEECKDMIRYHGWGFVLKVGVVDAELRVEPVDLVRN
jgi:hypothetical protein